MMIATAALPVASRSVAALLAGEGGVAADELRRLERKLAEARGLAADAEAKEGRDAGARAWLRELRDALYELQSPEHERSFWLQPLWKFS
jgi:hypothetical protein